MEFKRTVFTLVTLLSWGMVPSNARTNTAAFDGVECISTNVSEVNVAVGGVSKKQGTAVVAEEPFLVGEGTVESPYLIATIDDLILFRDKVNSGDTQYNAAGVHVALASDIDMAGVDWSINIGDDCNVTFDGVFDGKGYTLRNLNSVETASKSDGYVCTGLFGAIYGPAVVKNLVLENVTINTGDFTGNNAAAVVGFAYNCTGSVENVTVKGNIVIDAGNVTGTGVIVGYDYYSPSLSVRGCAVEADEGSSITGAAYVGGITGYASGGIALDNNSVGNIDVIATSCAAGGVAGIMLDGGSANGNTVSDVNLISSNVYWQNSAGVAVGCIASGKITVANTVFNNVTANGESARIVGSLHAEKPTVPVLRVPAVVGNDYYTSLQAAVEGVADGGTVTLLDDITFTTGANGGNNGISYTRGVDFTLDLNGKSVTSNLGGNTLRFKTGDGNSVRNTDVEVTVKNGRVVSGADNWCAISAAVAENSGNRLVLNLVNLDVENSKGGDYAIKSWAGAVINAESVAVTSSYGGSFYAVGGELVLDDCTAVQTGLYTAPYMSMAVAVSTNGKATVNSGTYSTVPAAASDAYNQGTSHGSWAVGVMNSGGTLVINGGTFSNGNYGDDSLATAARGLVFADSYGNVVVNGGIFNALKAVFDFQNNLGATSPLFTLYGGTYSANPEIVSSYGSVVIADNHVVLDNGNGYWSIETIHYDDFLLDDADMLDYTNTLERTAGTFTYRRTLVEGVWNPLYLPFEVSVSALADRYDIAYYNQMLSYDSDNNGSFDSYEMELAYITNGTLKANYPYFIRPKTAADRELVYVAENVTLYPATEYVIETSSVSNLFKLHGVHRNVSASDLAGCYTIKTNGNWVPTEIDLRPHRLYLKIMDSGNSPFKAAAAKSIRIVVRNEGAVSGIENVNDVTGKNMVYDLQGRRVEQLQQGNIYIIDGKKCVY